MTVGRESRILLRAGGPVRVERIEVDLIGDGEEGTIVRGIDLRSIGAVWFTPKRSGKFELQMRVYDVCGRSAVTGVRRDVTVDLVLGSVREYRQ